MDEKANQNGLLKTNKRYWKTCLFDFYNLPTNGSKGEEMPNNFCILID